MKPRLGLALVIAAALSPIGIAPAAGRHDGVRPSALALMPLPQAALSPAAATLRLDPDSGVVSNAHAGDDASGSPSASTFTRLGRRTGYRLHYADPTMAALDAGHGLIDVQTGVELYRDGKTATKGLAFWRRDSRSNPGHGISGVSISTSAVKVPGLGTPRGFGATSTLSVTGQRPLYATEIAFRSGQLVGTVHVSGADRATVESLAVALQHKLQSQIRLVLSGKAGGRPVPLPPKPKAGPPPGGPDLAPLALTPSDLGGGKMTHQGYEIDTDLSPVSEYVRELSPAGPYLMVDQEIALLHSPTQATYAAAILTGAFGSDELAKLLGDSAGSGNTSGKVTPVPAVTAGDQTYAVKVTLRFRGQSIDAGFIVMRVGRTLEIITVLSQPNSSIEPSQLNDLATKAASRVTAGLQPQPGAA